MRANRGHGPLLQGERASRLTAELAVLLHGPLTLWERGPSGARGEVGVIP